MKLPLPTLLNNGGFSGGHQYSPIDLCVAGIESTNNEIKIKNLKEFFMNNKYRECEDYLTIGIKNKNLINIKSITEWKHVLDESTNLSSLLKEVGPFTFNY